MGAEYPSANISGTSVADPSADSCAVGNTWSFASCILGSQTEPGSAGCSWQLLVFFGWRGAGRGMHLSSGYMRQRGFLFLSFNLQIGTPFLPPEP